MSREEWLDAESRQWQHDGLITEDTRRAILARYPNQTTDPSNALMPLAVLTAGVGVILFVAWHWQDLPWWLKLGLTKLLTIAMYGGAAWSAGRSNGSRPMWRGASSGTPTELWLLGAVLASFAFFGAIADVTAWDDVRTVGMWCALSAALTAALTGAALVTILAAATLAWWLLNAGGGLIPWEFLLIFPLVAVAAEQSRHRVAAVLSALAFGLWALIMASNTWNQPAPPMLLVVLAGAALEQWSHNAPNRRPAFARATPGGAMATGGLLMGLLMATHDTQNHTLSLMQTTAGQSPWPALALAAGLTLIAFGHPSRAAQRPRLIALAVLVWFNAALALRVGVFGPWIWVTWFSAALLFAGASYVRDAARTKDRGQFALGLTAVIGLVLVHFSSGAALRGATVLLGSALVLYLVGRRSAATASGEVVR